jgi:5'-methylthioadenosine phosphorylase
LEKARFAIIDGKGFESLFTDAEQVYLGTPYGIPPPLSVGKIGAEQVIFLHRHGVDHLSPPHKINYRANVYALYELGVERIIAVNAVGAINPGFTPGAFILPPDFVDFTKLRSPTFFDEAPVTHVDVSQPYCPEMRGIFVEKAAKLELSLCDKAVLVCTEGPRFETPAEIEMFRRLGCDIVGMTGVPEVVLARELQMCYVALCFVSNMAAGMQERLTANDVSRVCKEIKPRLEQLLTETVKALSVKSERNCPCAASLEPARTK